LSVRHTQSSELARAHPGLEVLAGSYVDLSWDYEYGTPEAALEAFAADNPELTSSAAAGLRHVLTTCSGDAELRAVLEPLGWGYTGGSSPLRRFLSWAVTKLETANPGEAPRAG
jgi:hypothetical protein